MQRKQINREIVNAIILKQDFLSHTGSLRAESHGDLYVIFSYREPIGLWCPDQNDSNLWFTTSRKFSATTSRHQRLAHQGILDNISYWRKGQIVTMHERLDLGFFSSLAYNGGS